MKVQLFIPCFVDQLYPQTAFNMVKVLEKATCEVTYNTNQTCCGQPAFNARDVPDVAQRDMVVGLPDEQVRTTDLERWSLPTRFGRQYRDALRKTAGLTLWTGLTCTEILTTESGDAVDHLVVKTLDGRQGRVVAADAQRAQAHSRAPRQPTSTL